MSYTGLNQEGHALFPAAVAGADARLKFIRNTYLMVFAGLVMFFAVAGGISFGALAGVPAAVSIVNAMVGIHPLIWFALLMGAMWGSQRLAMVKGLNVVVFFAFAAFMGLVTVPLMAFALSTKGLAIVGQALGLTVLVFGGLTAYVFISKKDFSFLRGFLMVGMFVILFAALGGIVASMMGYNVNVFHLGLSIAATLLISGFILYDTSNVLHHYATDMVVPAALALMTDFIVLFRNLLYLLSSRD